MIEQEMFFALGFVTAGLLALACLPAVWRRALRLTTRRLSQLVPLSGEEIAAERDQLRALMAVEQRRLEQRLESSEATRAALLADLGRKDGELAVREREAALARDRHAVLTGERDALQRELWGVMAGVGASEIALHDSTGLAERRRWEVLEAEARARHLEEIVDQGRASIAALETRTMGLESRMGDLNAALGSSRAELARTVEAVGRAMAERDAARRALEERAAEIAALRGARERAATGEEQSTETGDAASRDAVETIVALRREMAVQNAKLAELQNAHQPTEADLAVLREAIRQVADDVLRMTAGAAGRPERVDAKAAALQN